MITNTELRPGLIVIHDKTQGEYQIVDHTAMVKVGDGGFGPDLWQPAVTYWKAGKLYEQLFIRDTISFMARFSIKK